MLKQFLDSLPPDWQVALGAVVLSILGLIAACLFFLRVQISTRAELVKATAHAATVKMNADNDRRETENKIAQVKVDIEAKSAQSQLDNQRVIRDQFDAMASQIREASIERNKITERFETMRAATALKDVENARTIGNLEGTIGTLTSQQSELLKNLATLKQCVLELQDSAKELSNALDEKTDELRETKARLTDTEKRLTAADDAKSMLQKQVDGMQIELNKERSKVEALTRQVAALTDSLPATDKLPSLAQNLLEKEKPK